jgi:hypothetical protein
MLKPANRIRITALGIMAVLALGIGVRQDATGQDALPESLSGTWTGDVALTDCATGAVLPVPRNPFKNVNTYLPNGSLLETGGRFPNRSPGHGVWERTGHNTFRSRLMFFRYAPDDTYIGTQEVVRTHNLLSRDEHTTEAQVTLRDASGAVVGSGCAREHANRFTVDP